LNRSINLNSTQDLELIRPALVDWLQDCYSDDYDMETIAKCSTAYLAKRVNKEFEGGLRAFIEADASLTLIY